MKTLALISKSDSSIIKTRLVPDSAGLPELHPEKPFYWCVLDDTKPEYTPDTQILVREDTTVSNRTAIVKYRIVDKSSSQLAAEKEATEARTEFNTTIANGDAIGALRVLQRCKII